MQASVLGEGIMAKGDNIQHRLVQFGAGAMAACENFPRTISGRYAADQLLRAATAAAPNYAEARAAESRKDFVHKLRIALKEFNEAGVRLQIILQQGLCPSDKALILRQECTELSRILMRSVQTAEGRNPAERRGDRN